MEPLQEAAVKLVLEQAETLVTIGLCRACYTSPISLHDDSSPLD